MRLEPTQIEAILSLLSDRDEEILNSVRKQLFEMGKARVNQILDAAEVGTRARQEVEDVLRRLREPSLEQQFSRLAVTQEGDVDLEAGAFTLAKLGYPDAALDRYADRLDRMAAVLRPQISSRDHPIRVIRCMNHFLFKTHGFRGQENYSSCPDPDNSFLNRVMDRKRGLPIALSTITLLLARRLDLPFAGVGMPFHFIVKYKTDEDRDIFLDPFNKGQILTRNECADMLTRSGIPFKENSLREVSDREILTRMMVNLAHTYKALGRGQTVQTLARLVRMLSAH